MVYGDPAIVFTLPGYWTQITRVGAVHVNQPYLNMVHLVSLVIFEHTVFGKDIFDLPERRGWRVELKHLVQIGLDEESVGVPGAHPSDLGAPRDAVLSRPESEGRAELPSAAALGDGEEGDLVGGGEREEFPSPRGG